MEPGPWTDWLLWMGGAALGMLAGAWLGHSLFWDRARGRQRCAHCWYNLSGLPTLTCPECGHEARDERALRRTRRRWRRAALACLLVLAAYALWCVPGVRAHGWWAATPRPILALLIRHVPNPDLGAVARFPVPRPFDLEIQRRFFAAPKQLPPLWPGERFLLGVGARRALRPGASERAAQIGAALLVLVRDDAVQAAPEAGKARVILAASSLVYARCRSYRDTGMVKGSIGARDEKPFLTAFRRPGDFRFEFLAGFPSETRLSKRYVVWGKEPDIQSWWTLGAPGIGAYATIDQSLGGPTGISSGAAATIPTQLLRQDSWVTNLQSPAITGRETFDGHDCYVIRGMDFVNLPADVWIDTESLVLRKIHQHWDDPYTTIYRPELDVDIPDDLFSFDPASPGATPLGDGESASRALRDLAGNPRDGALLVPPEKRRIRITP